MVRTRLLLVAVAVVGLSAAGCSSSGSKPHAASSSADAATTMAVKYAQCMRTNGVTSFPDPVNGQFQLQVTKGGPLDPANPQFQAAQKACKALQPAGLSTGDSQSGTQQSQTLKFVACMRTNGVPNFPDPQDGHFLIQGGGVDPNSPQFQKAMQTCRKLLPGGGTGVGQ